MRRVAAFASPEAGHAVDIGDTFDRAVASLQAHAAYLAALGGPSADTFLRGTAEEAGRAAAGRDPRRRVRADPDLTSVG